MKIVVIHGQMHKGSTYNVARMFVDKIGGEGSQVKEYFLPADGPGFCVGCFTCITKSGELCPHSQKTLPVREAMKEADLLIFSTPNYVYDMTGQMKTFFDHFAYFWMPHRPEKSMFGKTALIVTSAAGAGTGKVIKSVKHNLFYWGIAKIYGFGFNSAAMNWEGVAPEKKAKLEKQVSAMALKIKKSIGRSRPNIKTKLIFNIMRLMQKSNTWNMTDRSHWEQNGWLGKERPW